MYPLKLTLDPRVRSIETMVGGKFYTLFSVGRTRFSAMNFDVMYES